MTDLHRLAKLVPILGSDKPGEVQAAVSAIGRLLAVDGNDWHDLAAAMVRGWTVPAKSPVATSEYEWQHMARACLKAHGSLSIPQVDFLRNMALRHTPPSEAQWRWLDAIAQAMKIEVPA